jgi:hypothetical protein
MGDEYMLIILTIAFTFLSIIISYRMKRDTEKLYFIKLFGLFALSITAISINSTYPIPIGFAVAFPIASGSRCNKHSKELCTLMGLISFIICATLYFFHSN